MKNNILFVTKDKGGFQVAMPVAKLLRSEYDLTIIADPEGVTFDLWKQAGFNPEIVNCLPQDVDMVVSTLGAPINLENQLSLEANQKNIPLIFIIK